MNITDRPVAHKHYASSTKPYKPWCNNILGKTGQFNENVFFFSYFVDLSFLSLLVVITTFPNYWILSRNLPERRRQTVNILEKL